MESLANCTHWAWAGSQEELRAHTAQLVANSDTLHNMATTTKSRKELFESLRREVEYAPSLTLVGFVPVVGRNLRVDQRRRRAQLGDTTGVGVCACARVCAERACCQRRLLRRGTCCRATRASARRSPRR
jgi:hypothetical protein